jgi:hypothetical protein
MAFHYSPNITTDGLILYMDPANVNSWTGTPLAPFSGGWKDLSRNMNSGALVGGFSYDSASKSFSVITATSTTPAWISTNTTLSFADTSAYSMEFTVKLRSNAQSTLHSLCGNGTTAPWVGISGSPINWRFFFRHVPSTYSYSNFITNYDISQNWAIICYTVATNRTIRFYLNGVFVSNTSPTPTTTILNVSRIAGGYSSGGNSGFPLQGSISTTRIYNRVLTDDEVFQNYNTTKSRFGL